MLRSFISSTTTLIALSATASAAVVFLDDFEAGANPYGGTTPDVTAGQSDGNTSGAINTTLWVRANQGFGSTRQGMVDESHGDFTDPAGEQAYAFRYTNSGITTASGVLGAVQLGDTITVTFDVVLDGHNNGSPYAAALVTFNGGARNDTRGFAPGTTSVLDSISGSYSGTTYDTVSFTYVVDGSDSAVFGHDLALRFDGATSTAIIDNVQVEIVSVPEPAAAMLGAFGGLLLLRRRR